MLLPRIHSSALAAHGQLYLCGGHNPAVSGIEPLVPLGPAFFFMKWKKVDEKSMKSDEKRWKSMKIRAFWLFRGPLQRVFGPPRSIRACECYDPRLETWKSLPDMRPGGRDAMEQLRKCVKSHEIHRKVMKNHRKSLKIPESP